MSFKEEDIQREVGRLNALISMRSKSREYIRGKAIEILERKEAEMDIPLVFSDKVESKKARELLNKYLNDYTIETISDKTTLGELINLEVIQARLYDKINTAYKQDKNAIPLKLLESIHKNAESILTLKQTLGLYRKKDLGKVGFNAIKDLMKRTKLWRDKNQASRSLILPIKCENCGHTKARPIMLKIRTDIWEAQKHPFFEDRVLYNKHLIAMYKKGQITTHDVALVLECSDDYIDWVIQRIEKGQNESPQEQMSKM